MAVKYVTVCLLDVLQGQEYAESYMLQYKRLDNDGWTLFHDRRGSEVRLTSDVDLLTYLLVDYPH